MISMNDALGHSQGLKDYLLRFWEQYKKTKDILPWYIVGWWIFLDLLLSINLIAAFTVLGFYFFVVPLIMTCIDHPHVCIFTHRWWTHFKHELRVVFSAQYGWLIN